MNIIDLNAQARVSVKCYFHSYYYLIVKIYDVINFNANKMANKKVVNATVFKSGSNSFGEFFSTIFVIVLLCDIAKYKNKNENHLGLFLKLYKNNI